MAYFSKMIISVIGFILILQLVFPYCSLHPQLQSTSADQILSMKSSQVNVIHIASKYKKSFSPLTSASIISVNDEKFLLICVSILIFISSYISIVKKQEKLLAVKFQANFLLK